ncbi:PqiC family protein [Oleidesulfovibrio sp.]|uniref:PqiC family protein n=1 Tax=Oleidesulfovibrio sp. TaxID=2909707 RepID=UPI003A8B5A33
MKFRVSNVLFLISLLVVLGGCGGKSAPTRFYMLEAGSASPSLTQASPVVILEEVTIPPYLDRPNIVTRTSGARVHLAEFDYWAEPLRDAVARHLLMELSRASGATVIVAHSVERDFTLKVAMLRFDATEDGQAILQAMWRLEPYQEQSGGSAKSWRHASYSEKATDSSYAAIVNAQSRLLSKLAEEIATSIK